MGNFRRGPHCGLGEGVSPHLYEKSFAAQIVVVSCFETSLFLSRGRGEISRFTWGHSGLIHDSLYKQRSTGFGGHGAIMATLRVPPCECRMMCAAEWTDRTRTSTSVDSNEVTIHTRQQPM